VAKSTKKVKTGRGKTGGRHELLADRAARFIETEPEKYIRIVEGGETGLSVLSGSVPSDPPVPGEAHNQQTVAAVPCAVLTISDTRTVETDTAGQWICQALVEAGHRVLVYEILRDEPVQIAARLKSLAAQEPPTRRSAATESACRAILMSGGTGLAPRDSTFEAVDAMLEKRLTGFGELFRWLSYAEIGPAAMLSRATAGTIGSAVVFSMPGSPAAVRLAVEKLILPEMGHIVHLLGA